MRRRIFGSARRFASAVRGIFGRAGGGVRRLGNPDTALFVGWAMASVGFGLIHVAAGLIVGGTALAGGALIAARGDQ